MGTTIARFHSGGENATDNRFVDDKQNVRRQGRKATSHNLQRHTITAHRRRVRHSPQCRTKFGKCNRPHTETRTDHDRWSGRHVSDRLGGQLFCYTVVDSRKIAVEPVCCFRIQVTVRVLDRVGVDGVRSRVFHISLGDDRVLKNSARASARADLNLFRSAV